MIGLFNLLKLPWVELYKMIGVTSQQIINLTFVLLWQLSSEIKCSFIVWAVRQNMEKFIIVSPESILITFKCHQRAYIQSSTKCISSHCGLIWILNSCSYWKPKEWNHSSRSQAQNLRAQFRNFHLIRHIDWGWNLELMTRKQESE